MVVFVETQLDKDATGDDLELARALDERSCELRGRSSPVERQRDAPILRLRQSENMLNITEKVLLSP